LILHRRKIGLKSKKKAFLNQGDGGVGSFTELNSLLLKVVRELLFSVIKTILL
jgi:hypothetical protein